MLLQLDFDVTFSHPKAGSTGRLSGTHSFQQGLTAITGANETGKSFRLEMMRYALWGVSALRAKASDFLKITVALVWKIGEDVYKVTRTKTSAKLYRNNKEIVTGTSPVNAEIMKVFGYNMEVFDVANACLQGEVEALSRMKPTERKKMVDHVIGLDTIDDLITEVSKDMAGQRMLIDSMERRLYTNLVQPDAPYTGYVQSAQELQLIVDGLHREVAEASALGATLLALNCDEPVNTTYTEPMSVEELYELRSKAEIAHQKMRYSRDALNKVVTIPEMKLPYDRHIMEKYVSEKIDEVWGKIAEHKASADMYSNWVMGKLPLSELIQLRLVLEHKDTIYNIFKLELHKVNCPKCTHEFSLSQDQIDKLKATIPQMLLDDTQFWLEELEKSGYKTLKQIDTDIDLYKSYEEFNSQPQIDEPKICWIGRAFEVQSLLDKYNKYLEQVAEEGPLRKQYEEDSNAFYELGVDLDLLNQRIKVRTQEDKEVANFNIALTRYEQFKKFTKENGARIRELKDVDQKLADFKHKLTLARDYEKAMQDFMLKSQANEDLNAEIKASKDQLDELTRIRKALNEIKPRVKLYLVPSLNRVASHLVSQMTNGERTNIEVDENFEISVDGQPIDTLSGSAKAVANLAIRIGLGTVLTSKVFSVLLADEVDAAMDKDRAAFTAQCLRGLTNTFSQIILVSHQKPEADHQIEL